MCQADDKVGVAVSGGADSIYLLHYLLGQSLNLTVLHVNHKLRGPESDADEDFARRVAASLGLRFLTNTAPLVLEGNMEQSAREARNRWFHSLIENGTVTRVALGHTQSDQAETVLFRFLRGSGTAGLAAIRPETSDGFVRPLLHLTREHIRESLRERGIPWREDSSNESARFARNRIRHSLLPQLTRDWNPALTQTLAHTADWALAEEAFWAAELDRLAETYFRLAGPYLIVQPIGDVPLAVQRRLIRHAILKVKGDLRQIDFSHIEAIRALRSGRIPLHGILVERSFGYLRFGPTGPSVAEFRHRIEPPAVISMPESGLTLSLELTPAECVYNGGKHQLDWGRVSGSLELRNWHPGDRYRRVGRSNEEKLKFLFQKARIPVWERQSWPVLLCGNQIAWTRHFGPGAQLARSPETRTVLVVQEKSNRNW